MNYQGKYKRDMQQLILVRLVWHILWGSDLSRALLKQQISALKKFIKIP